MDVKQIIAGLDEEISRLERVKELLTTNRTAPVHRAIHVVKPARHISAAGRARIAAAQKARWAAQKKAAKAAQTAKEAVKAARASAKEASAKAAA